jgi:hypothetical protein
VSRNWSTCRIRCADLTLRPILPAAKMPTCRSLPPPSLRPVSGARPAGAGVRSRADRADGARRTEREHRQSSDPRTRYGVGLAPVGADIATAWPSGGTSKAEIGVRELIGSEVPPSSACAIDLDTVVALRADRVCGRPVYRGGSLGAAESAHSMRRLTPVPLSSGALRLPLLPHASLPFSGPVAGS